MMAKRNTEGYVLAYLLIVITVMGVIAATLMTSTLQVVQAQEHSLVYMKDKYEAMGAVEKLLAELDATFTANPPSAPSEGIALFKSTNFETSEIACNQAKAKLEDWLTNASNISLNIPQNFTFVNETATFSYTAQSDTSSIEVVANLKMPYQVDIIPDPEYGPDPANPDGDEILIDTDYSFKILIKSYVMDSYTISSIEGGGT